MATEGLLQWANTVRLTMATDPGRAFFKEQVQTHGFSFLDSYLNNILLNAKQDALIELVKTPGRKKTFAKKLKLAHKPRDGIALFSKDEDHRQGVSQDNTKDSMVTHPSSEQCQSTEDLPMQVKVPNTVLAQLTPCDELLVSTSTCPSLVDSLQTKELSIIAEDDESSRVSLPSVDQTMQGTQAGERSIIVNLGNDHSPRRNTVGDVDGADQQVLTHGNEQGTNMDGNENIHSQGNYDPSTDELDSVKQNHGIVEDGEAMEQVILESQSPRGDGPERVVVPLRNPDSAPPSPRNNVASFPPLPLVAPLRKSVRTLENSAVIGPLGAVTLGVPITSKRTSWLQKVRQAKAMEFAGKKTPSILSSANSLQPPSTTLLTSNAKRKSTEAFSGSAEDEDERRHKIAKTMEAETAAMGSSNINTVMDAANAASLGPAKPISSLPSEAPQPERQFVELNLLKKMVEGHNARTGRSMGKSLGGSAATALAEARAAAEARIAERNVKENETMTMVHYTAVGKSNERSEEQHGSRPFVTDPSSHSGAMDSATAVVSPTASDQPAPVPNATGIARDRERQSIISTTPPNTPPVTKDVKDVFIPPPGPVFNKPPPVFVPPSKTVRDIAQGQVEKPDLDDLPSISKNPLSKELAFKSAPSDTVFDDDRNLPAWMLNTQDTHARSIGTNICDEDDSWPIDEKLAEGVHWIYGDAKDDNTTWSSLPSQPNTIDLSKGTFKSVPEQEPSETQHYLTGEHVCAVLDTCDVDMDQKETQMQVDTSDSEVEEVTQNATMSTVSLVDSSKSQSQLGLFSQATRLIGNMMGSGKKAKPEVQKVLQKAAIAAKKQQEESDKKAARLKEMENRRQLAIQRKAEEEKSRIMEQEKKIKEENERRKREREEHTDKRLLKAPSSRKDDDTVKKRKIEAEKKAEIKNSTNPLKSAAKPALKQPSALSSSTTYNSSLGTSGILTKSNEVKSNASLAAKAKGKMSAKAPAAEEDLPQPSQIVQTQMAARAKAQLQAARQAQDPPPVPSESIELPDINSEYSDSEDEDRQRTFDPPDWAQSPELRQALQQQSTINPDDVFGAIRPLKMEEIFKTRTSRFRARTSSANWAGADRLTIEEEKEYARRMGFK